jgi:hypothetical protein
MEIEQRWSALINWCQTNPYCTIERLEIVAGAPELIVIKKQLSKNTTAKVRIRYDVGAKLFTTF